MKYLFLPAIFFSAILSAQTSLKFDKRFVQSEDKWVAFQMDEDSTHVYGFIYIDAQAGLTLNYEGKFKITPQGKYVPAKALDSLNASFKVRLNPNRVLVAHIPESKFAELKIEAIPDWLSIYKGDTTSVQRLYRWGFLYNLWNECEKALTYLMRAEKIDPIYKGLQFEIAFAYNALGHFEKAITVCEKAIIANPTECYLYKELSYAQLHLEQFDKAAVTCKKGIEVCTEKPTKAEIAYNLAYKFFEKKDKENFKIWADETKKWATKDDQFMKAIGQMESMMKD